jgi:hypothetical protein
MFFTHNSAIQSPAAEGNAEENACEKGKQKKKKKHKRMDANSADLKPEQVEELKKLSEEAAEHGPVVHIPLTGYYCRPLYLYSDLVAVFQIEGFDLMRPECGPSPGRT